MNRTRRKPIESQNIQNKIDSEDQNDSESEDSRRNPRMNAEHEEMFVKLCVENFDEINDTSTIKGTPVSSNVKIRKKKMDDAWDKITLEMNRISQVILNEFLFYAKMLLLLIFSFEYVL